MYERQLYLKRYQKKPSKIYKIIRIFIFISVLVFTINVFSNTFIYASTAKGSFFVSPLAKDIIKTTISLINSYENSKQIESIVVNVLGKDVDNFGIVIKNLSTGERYYLNEEKNFTTASLYKLWVMAEVFKQADEKKLSMSDVLTDSIDNLNKSFNISSESAELTEGTLTLSVEKALERMIIFSDNYSAMLLTRKVKVENVRNLLKENGFNQSQVGTLNSSPITSAKDAALFLNKIYEGKLINKEKSKEMINLLKRQQLNGKIPRNLPDEVEIAHKTGELGGISHDVGIVYTPNSDYIIVVLSLTKDTVLANNKISKISEGVFSYFNK